MSTPSSPEVMDEFADIKDELPIDGMFDLLLPERIKSTEMLIDVVRNKPAQILHFSGHGDEYGYLLVDGNPVTDEILRFVANDLKQYTKCIILNACETEAQAKIVAETVGCAIGTTEKIDATDAKRFAKHFYKSIVSGQTIAQSVRDAILLSKSLDGATISDESYVLSSNQDNIGDFRFDNTSLIEVQHPCKPVNYTGKWPIHTTEINSQGNNIIAIQFLLRHHRKHIERSSMGKFDLLTKASVMSFQKEAGLPVDGDVGATVWEKLIVSVRRGVFNDDAVRAVQFLLQQKFCYDRLSVNGEVRELDVDGDFGPITETAIKLFQELNHLDLTGIVDAKVWSYLVGEPS